MVGERDDVIPPQLLRIGVQFADGRTATNISGHDCPVGGPAMWALGGSWSGSVMRASAGGGSGGEGGSHFDQGYWISPLPPAGPVAVVCEWPVAGIPVLRRDLDGQAIRDAAQRARAMFPNGHQVLKDGREWRLGTDADVVWINDGVSPGTTVTATIPPIFAAYCTLELPTGDEETELVQHERAVIELLTQQTKQQPWWLGYLDTGASDVVFPYAPRTTLYEEDGYVLVKAGPEQALAWRTNDSEAWNETLPDLLFPADHSWLLSTTMWDYEFTSIGGPEPLINSIIADSELGPRAHRVRPDERLPDPS